MHMPLLRNTDRSKISKRKNPVSLRYYERQGYLPEALLNFLALMGWSMPDESEVFTLDEMVESFSFERISLGGPVFDLQKLAWLNGMYIRKLPPAALSQLLQENARAKSRLLNDSTYIDAITPLLQERLHTLGDFQDMASYFYDTPLAYDKAQLLPKGRSPREAVKVLTEVSEALSQHAGPWQDAELEASVRGYIENAKWPGRDLFMALRIAVTGRAASPPLFATMQVLGKDLCLSRLEDAVALLQK